MIKVYGKPGCVMCDKAKDKLARLGLAFEFVDVSGIQDSWRETDGVEFLTEKTWREDDGKPELPLLLIDGKWHNYPEAMKNVRATSPVADPQAPE